MDVEDEEIYHLLNCLYISLCITYFLLSTKKAARERTCDPFESTKNIIFETLFSSSSPLSSNEPVPSFPKSDGSRQINERIQILTIMKTRAKAVTVADLTKKYLFKQKDNDRDLKSTIGYIIRIVNE
jgi:hypothetical protein